MRQLKPHHSVILIAGAGLALLALLCLTPGEASAAGGAFGGGDGTAGNPYLVEDVNDLQNLSADLQTHYRLVGDIEANATSGWNGGAGFDPIGDQSNRFTGSLDGRNFTIFNLTIDRSGQSYVGLFGSLDIGAVVSGLILKDGYVDGGNYVGAVAGLNYGTLSNVTSETYTTGYNYIRGIVGFNQGLISNATNHGDTKGPGSFNGGIAGYNDDGTITDATNHGDVDSGGAEAGGIVGECIGGDLGGLLNHGHVNGSGGHFGGILGLGSGCDISKATNHGNVSGVGSYHGGIAGYIELSEITDATNHGFVSGIGSELGGIVGYSDRNTLLNAVNHGTVIGLRWHTYSNVGGVIGGDTGSHITNVTNHGTVTGLGGNTGGVVGYSRLGTIKKATNHGPVNGSGDDTGGIGGELGSDLQGAINLGQVTGQSNVGGIAGRCVSGTVRNVTNQGDVTGSGDGVGGIIGSHSGILNNATNRGPVSGNKGVGGIIGSTSVGSIAITSNYADVAGAEEVGGVMGWNDRGYLWTSFNHGAVNGGTVVGGVVGHNQGEARNSGSLGPVSGTGPLGGLAGSNTQTVDDSFSAGPVTGSGAAGGLAGDSTGTISDSFWDLETSGQSASDGGTGLNTSAMMDLATYKGAGWIFKYTWAIRDGLSYPFPYHGDWNLDPSPMDDHYTVPADEVLHLPASGVLANDHDLDALVFPHHLGGDVLSVRGADAFSLEGAVVTVDPDGSLIYDPTSVPHLANLSAGEYRVDSFTYLVEDDLGGATSAMVYVNVTGLQVDPTLLAVEVPEGVVGTAYRLPLAAYDPNGEVLHWSMETNASWLELNATTGVVTGVPDRAGSCRLRVTVADSHGRADRANLTLTVLADLDGDGLPDVWDKDDDGDGWSDATEALAGTDAGDASSRPKDANDDGIPDALDDDGEAGAVGPLKAPLWAYGTLVATAGLGLATMALMRKR